MPGRDPSGALITIVIGIVGAVIGGFLGRALLGYGNTADPSAARPGTFMSLVLAVIGSIILLAIYRMIKGRGSPALRV